MLVAEPNRLAIDIFQRCQINVIGGMGAFYYGISATEFMSAAKPFRVKKKDLLSEMDKVQMLGRTIGKELNDGQKRK